MDAIRCTECGDVRWSILGRGSKDPGPCEMCGAETVRERRHPNRSASDVPVERRDVTPAAYEPRA